MGGRGQSVWKNRKIFPLPAKELDEETGYYYFGARYYDPKVSMWISPDPAIDKYLPTADQLFYPEDKFDFRSMPGIGGVYNSVNLNVYHYAGQNPVKLSDPSGEHIISAQFKAEGNLILGASIYGGLVFQINHGKLEKIYAGGGITLSGGIRADVGLDVNYYPTDTFEEFENQNWGYVSGDLSFVGVGVNLGKNKGKMKYGANASVGYGFGFSAGTSKASLSKYIDKTHWKDTRRNYVVNKLKGSKKLFEKHLENAKTDEQKTTFKNIIKELNSAINELQDRDLD